jgi:hypothetical protein
MATLIGIVAKLNQVDKLWDMGFTNYDDDEDDDKELFVSEKIDHVSKWAVLGGGPIDKGGFGYKSPN